MKKYTPFFIAISVIALLLSCNNSKKTIAADATVAANSGTEMLYQFQWNLTELNSVAVPSTAKAFFLLSPGQPNKVSGNTGCNLMNGSFELSGTSGIKFSAFATTRRACIDNSIANMEQKFLDALATSSTWVIKDTVLLLSHQNTIVAKLKGATIGNN
jgi:heat shock protein HslJ